MKKTLLIGAIVAGLYFVTAVLMTFWPEPGFSSTPSLTEVLERAEASGLSREQVYEYEDRRFQMRDGAELSARQFVSDSDVTVVLLHGVTGDSGNFNRTSGMIRERCAAEVFALDLRGHGESSGRRGDIDHIGQYEEDVADAIAEIRASKPASRVTLAGHSMGGGIALRYAMLEEAPPADGYLLFAPLLGSGSPTVRTEPPEGSDGGYEYMKIHAPRLFGLIMLNVAGIDWFNGLTTLFINLPPELPVREYSFRALASMTPEPYGAGLEAVGEPLLVLVGSDDEAFHAEEFEGAVSAHSAGGVKVIEGETHDGLHHNDEAIETVCSWMASW